MVGGGAKRESCILQKNNIPRKNHTTTTTTTTTTNVTPINNVMKLNTLFEQSVIIPGKSPDGYPDYMRSIEEIKKNLTEHNLPGTLNSIIKLFSKYNLLIADNIELNIKTNAINAYKEYDRSADETGWTGKMSGDEYTDLRDDISKNGIKSSVMLQLERLSNGDVDVKLGEGNHRLRIANELGIERLKIRFYYIK